MSFSRKSRKSQFPTLEDVARHAEVSTATVSRCLNFPGRVKTDTRTKVEDAIQALGYTPNFSAKALAAKRTNTIGVVIPTMENSIFARGVQAFQDELRRHGKTLLIASSRYDPTMEEEQIRILIERGAEALMLIGYERSDDIYEFLAKRNIPFVITWAFQDSAHHSSIGFDNKKAMIRLTNKVIDLGHEVIGVISASTARNDRARDRVAGIKHAMEQRGLDLSQLLVEETSYTIDAGLKAVNSLLLGPQKPTVIMCGNDVLAVGALKGAKMLGLNVPDDISITGFDAIELAEVASPSLTTVHVPHRDMGLVAARVLVEAINGEGELRSVELESNIVMGNSLARVKSSGA